MAPDQVIRKLKELVGPMPAWSPTAADPRSELQHARWVKWSSQQELIEAYAQSMKRSQEAEGKKSKSASTDPPRSRDYISSPLRDSRL